MSSIWQLLHIVEDLCLAGSFGKVHVWAVLVWRVSKLVLTCTCLRRTWHEALSSPGWIYSYVYMYGLGLAYLIIIGSSRCTPSLWTGNV
jgi:hypothetical protein